MTCDDILVQLLDADPDDLIGRGSSPVAQHVRDCARCRAVAGTIVRETSLLGAAVASASVPMPGPHTARPDRRGAPMPWLLPVGLTAAGIATLAIIRGDGSPTLLDVVRHEPVTAAATASSHGTPPSPPRFRTQSSDPVAIVAHAVSFAPLPAPDAVLPSQVGAPMPDTSSTPDPVAFAADTPGLTAESVATTVIVAPPAGADARVKHTRNPRITIVWITDES